MILKIIIFNIIITSTLSALCCCFSKINSILSSNKSYITSDISKALPISKNISKENEKIINQLKEQIKLQKQKVNVYANKEVKGIINQEKRTKATLKIINSQIYTNQVLAHEKKK